MTVPMQNDWAFFIQTIVFPVGVYTGHIKCKKSEIKYIFLVVKKMHNSKISIQYHTRQRKDERWGKKDTELLNQREKDVQVVEKCMYNRKQWLKNYHRENRKYT